MRDLAVPRHKEHRGWIDALLSPRLDVAAGEVEAFRVEVQFFG
jgi:hypothetical protein